MKKSSPVTGTGEYESRGSGRLENLLLPLLFSSASDSVPVVSVDGLKELGQQCEPEILKMCDYGNCCNGYLSFLLQSGIIHFSFIVRKSPRLFRSQL